MCPPKYVWLAIIWSCIKPSRHLRFCVCILVEDVIAKQELELQSLLCALKGFRVTVGSMKDVCHLDKVSIALCQFPVVRHKACFPWIQNPTQKNKYDIPAVSAVCVIQLTLWDSPSCKRPSDWLILCVTKENKTSCVLCIWPAAVVTWEESGWDMVCGQCVAVSQYCWVRWQWDVTLPLSVNVTLCCFAFVQSIHTGSGSVILIQVRWNESSILDWLQQLYGTFYHLDVIVLQPTCGLKMSSVCIHKNI